MNKIEKEEKWGFTIDRVSFEISKDNCANIDYDILCKNIDGLKQASLKHKKINLDKYLQTIMYAIRNYSTLSKLGISKDFVLKHDNRSNINYDNNMIQFTDWIIMHDKLRKVNTSNIKYLYHYSNLKLTHLTPTYGGIAGHTFYSRPRIYCSRFPTAKNGFPLLICEKGNQELTKYENKLKTLDSLVFDKNIFSMINLKLIINSIIDGKSFLYRFPVKNYNIYEDFEQDKSDRNDVFFIETLENIRIEEINENRLTIKYLQENFPTIYRFYKENINLFDAEIPMQKIYKNKLNRVLFSDLTNRLNRINFSYDYNSNLLGMTYDNDTKYTRTIDELLRDRKGICYDFVNYQYFKNKKKGHCYFMWFNNHEGSTHTIYVDENGYYIEMTPPGDGTNVNKEIYKEKVNNIEKLVEKMANDSNITMEHHMPKYVWCEYIPTNKRQTIDEFIDERWEDGGWE